MISRTLKICILGLVASGMALIICLALLIPGGPAMAAPGGITDNSGLIPFQQSYFAFEVESPIGSLTDTPIWDEVEQMLDNPYQFVYEPTVRRIIRASRPTGSTFPRRRLSVFRDGSGNPCAPGSAGCVEVPHVGYLTHPLNYTTTAVKNAAS